MSAGVRPGMKRRLRQGHRRLQRGHPTRPEGRQGLRRPGRRLVSKREYDKAIADFTEAIRLDPKDAEAYSDRGAPGRASRSTTRRSPTSTRPSGSIPKLRALTATGATPGSQGGVRQGDRRLQRGHPARPEVTPRRTAAGATPGQAKREYDKAIADFNEAIRLDPKRRRCLRQPRQRLD